jgi:2'-5' RNA ligase
MRLFIALNLPKKERERVYRAAKPLREGDMPIRWIGADQYHVTLKFLGDVRRERVPAVEEAIAKIAQATKGFSTKFGGFGAFPTIRRPRVIWLGLAANPELRCLKQDLEWTMGDVGFDAETRAFHPHVTLGRADDRGGAGAFRGLDDLMAEMKFRGSVKVHTVDLMRSQLSKEGAKYTVLSSHKLVGTGI